MLQCIPYEFLSVETHGKFFFICENLSKLNRIRIRLDFHLFRSNPQKAWFVQTFSSQKGLLLSQIFFVFSIEATRTILGYSIQRKFHDRRRFVTTTATRGDSFDPTASWGNDLQEKVYRAIEDGW